MKPRYIDLTGNIYGRLTVVEIDRIQGSKRPFWTCRCECGNVKSIRGSDLRSGDTNSCGCLARELTSNRSISHGKSKTRTYKTWQSMRSRCNNPNDEHYSWYGGRGISVDPRWDVFSNFLEDMGERPLGMIPDSLRS